MTSKCAKKLNHVTSIDWASCFPNSSYNYNIFFFKSKLKDGSTSTTQSSETYFPMSYLLGFYLSEAGEFRINNSFHIMKMYKDKVSTKMSKIFFINVWRKSVFDIYFTEFGAALKTVLPVLFKYCYKYCYSDSGRLWAVMKGGGLAL